MDQVSRTSIARLGYNALSARWKALFGRPARRVPLDAGAGCPNRDGTVSTGGCAFCNASGSGTGRGATSLAEQWACWRERLHARWGEVALVGYLQAYSNTHGPAQRLAATLEELAALPGMAGLCLATRPDCLDEHKADILAQARGRAPWLDFWLELGLQSSNPATLARVNRGHGPQCFARAVDLARSRGLPVAAHVMAGLPGETPEDWDATVDHVDALGVDGIKFHNLHVARGTALARELERGHPPPELTLEGYAEWVALAVARLRPEVVVHRLSADPAHGELLHPAWAGDRVRVRNAVNAALKRLGVRQGMNRPGQTSPGARSEEIA